MQQPRIKKYRCLMHRKNHTDCFKKSKQIIVLSGYDTEGEPSVLVFRRKLWFPCIRILTAPAISILIYFFLFTHKQQIKRYTVLIYMMYVNIEWVNYENIIKLGLILLSYCPCCGIGFEPLFKKNKI